MLDDALVVGVANHTKGGKLPFSLGGEAIVGNQDAVLATHLTGFATGAGVKVVEFVLRLATILASQVNIGLEGRFATQVGQVENNDTLVDKNLLVDAVGTPDAVFLSLLPADSDNRILVVDGALEIIVHKALAPSQLVAPAVGVGIYGTHALGIFLAIGAFHPIYIFAIHLVRDLSFVHIERRNGDVVGNVIPLETRIIGDAAHSESATLDEHEARSGDLLVILRHFKSAPFRVVVVPTRGSRFLLAAARDDQGGD